MISKEKKKYDYSKLKRKVFSRMLLFIGVTVFGVFLLRALVQRSFSLGDSVALFLMNNFHMSEAGAVMLTRTYLMNNKEGLTLILILFALILLVRFAVGWFMRYFDEINGGIDRLVEETDAEITLSPELDFMEKKLNQIKNNLERQKKAALDAEKKKNELVMYLAHDIKTPLTSVIGYLSLLDEATDMPIEQKAKYVGITLEKAYRLEQLMDEFFEITRFSLQSIVLVKETINLERMLRQLADEFYPMLAPGGKEIRVMAPEGLTLEGDPDKLARVFNNILKNAIAYSYEKSTICITAVEKAGSVEILFSNQGNPIPPEKISSIFEKFFRLDGARSTNTGGSGLGLAIAKEIVSAHGGTISVASDEKETLFSVILPKGIILRKS